MSCNEEIHLNDIGTIFRLTIVECVTVDGVKSIVPVNLTLVDSVEIYFGKPTLPNVKKNGTVYDAVNGIVQYETVAGDLDELRTWYIQAKAIFAPGTQEHSSNVDSFTVYPNIEIDV